MTHRLLSTARTCALLCTVLSAHTALAQNSATTPGTGSTEVPAQGSNSPPATTNTNSNSNSNSDTDTLAMEPATAANPYRGDAHGAIGPLLRIEITPALEGEDPFARLGLRRGELLTPARARAALQAALNSGTFADARLSVRSEGRGVVLVLRGARRITVREVAYSGVSARNFEAVRSDFGIADGASVTDADVAAATLRLQRGYREAGWLSASVTSRWRQTDDPAVRLLLVSVTEGTSTTVRRVVLRGVPSELQNAVREASGIREGQLADPDVLRRAGESVYTVFRRGCTEQPRRQPPEPRGTDILGGRLATRADRNAPTTPEAEGVSRGCYLNAEVQPIRFESVDRSHADAIIEVNAGPAFSIEWAGVGGLIRRTALLETLRLSEEHQLDTTTLASLVNRVRDWYVRRAFLDVQVRADAENLSATRARLRFTVSEGPRVFVRNVLIEGATHIDAGTLRDLLIEYLNAELTEREGLGDPGEDVVDMLNGGPVSSAVGPPQRLRLYPDRTYVPDLYAEAARRMATRYHEQGFLDAEVPAPTVRRVQDARGTATLDVVFRVSEGPRTIFDEVVFEGNDALPAARLAQETTLRLGLPLSYAALEEARSALLEFYREQGYYFVRIDPQVDRSPDRTRARVRFVVREGPRVRVGRVLVRGNNRTQRGIIEERVLLRPGELFRPSLVRTSQRQLMELGIFSAVTITPADPDAEAPVKDVVVRVFELRAQALEGRLGVSTGEGIRAALEYQFRNLGGYAITLAARAQFGYLIAPTIPDPTFRENYSRLSILSALRRRLSLSFGFPALPWVGPSVRATVDLGNARIIERQFAIDTLSAAASLTYRPNRAFTLTVTQEAQSNGLELLGLSNIEQVLQMSMGRPDFNRIRQLLLLPDGTTGLLATRAVAVIDLRDQVFNPQRGWLFSLTAEYVHILSYASTRDPMSLLAPHHTLRAIASATGYALLPIGNVVLSSNLRFGFNADLQPDPADAGGAYVNRTYANRLFFLGGADSMRAWIQDTFLPDDVVNELRGGCDPDTTTCTPPDVNSVLLAQRGGNAFVNWRTELRIPIGQSGFSLGLFLDVGNLWKNPANFNPLRLRGAAGIGIRYSTPIGPLALDLGFNLRPRTDLLEIIAAPNFSISLF